MDPELLLNILDAILIVGIALPSVYMAMKIGQRKLRLLTLLLAGFLVLHGLYHITAALGGLPGLSTFGALSNDFVEPLGWLIFLSFTVYFARNS